MSRPRDLAAVEIYDGRRFLGAILERAPRRWRAINIEGRRIGEYPTREQARLAALTSAKHRPEARPQ